MNKEAVLNHLKQIKIPLPGLFIVIAWLMISYLLYPHKTQKPEVKGISDSGVVQLKPSPTIMPTPKVRNVTSFHTSETPTPTASQTNVSSSAIAQNNSSLNNSAVSSDSNDSNTVSPTQIPSSSNTSDVENSPTSTPPPSANETENTINPSPTATQPSNNNNSAVGNSIATTVNTLSQVVPIELNLPK